MVVLKAQTLEPDCLGLISVPLTSSVFFHKLLTSLCLGFGLYSVGMSENSTHLTGLF